MQLKGCALSQGHRRVKGGGQFVILNFQLAGTLRAKLRSGLIRHRNTLVVVAASVLTVMLTLHLLAPVAVPNLAQPVNATRALDLAQSWAKGDVIALVRHAERCDRSSKPCLGPLDGITERAVRTAQVVGADFKQLGLNKVDIYSSQMTRTRQTANAMFTRPVAAQDWLFDCRGSILHDALKHKVAGRNLVLITHSECMDALVSDLHAATNTSFGYATALFINADGAQGGPQMLGYIEPEHWSKVIPLAGTPSPYAIEASQF